MILAGPLVDLRDLAFSQTLSTKFAHNNARARPLQKNGRSLQALKVGVLESMCFNFIMKMLGTRRLPFDSGQELQRIVNVEDFLRSLEGQPVLQCHASDGKRPSLQLTIAGHIVNNNGETRQQASISVWARKMGSAMYIAVDGVPMEYADFVSNYVPDTLAETSTAAVAAQITNLVQVKVEKVAAMAADKKPIEKYWHGSMQLWLKWHGKSVVIGDFNVDDAVVHLWTTKANSIAATTLALSEIV